MQEGDALSAAPPVCRPASGEELCARGVHYWLVEARPGGIDRYTCQRPGCGATKEQTEEKAKNWQGQPFSGRTKKLAEVGSSVQQGDS